MKPPRFDYHAPRALTEAIDLIARHGGAARVLAGGQSLVPMLNFRLAQPEALVDLRHVPGLAGIEAEAGTIRIGAMTRQRQAEHSPVIAQHLPLMAAALQWVGHAPTRSRGTIGGSIAHADPSAELPMVLRALDGEVVASGPSGARVIPADALFQSMFTTALAPDEILTEVRLPAMPAGCACAIEEFARRPGDFGARIAVAGASEAVFRAFAAEQLLATQGAGAEGIAAAAALASEACTPMSDPRVSADYRRHLIRVLTRRALERAAAQPGPWHLH